MTEFEIIKIGNLVKFPNGGGTGIVKSKSELDLELKGIQLTAKIVLEFGLEERFNDAQLDIWEHIVRIKDGGEIFVFNYIHELQNYLNEKGIEIKIFNDKILELS